MLDSTTTTDLTIMAIDLDTVNNNNVNGDTVKYRRKANIAISMAAIAENNNEWYLESCCNVHIMPHKSRFATYRRFEEAEKIAGLGGRTETAEGIGSVAIRDLQGRRTYYMVFCIFQRQRTQFFPSSKPSTNGWELRVIENEGIQFVHSWSQVCLNVSSNDNVLQFSEALDQGK